MYFLSVANTSKIILLLLQNPKKILQSLDPLATNQYICRRVLY